jgi:hypothetical protein
MTKKQDFHGASGAVKEFCIRFCEFLPVKLPVFFLCFGSVAILLLLFNCLYIWLLLLIGSIAYYFANKVINKHYQFERPGSLRERQFFDILVVVGVLLWMVVNIRYTSQNIYSYRDPGVYALTASWIQDNKSLDIPETKLLGDKADISKLQLKTGSAGFGGSLVERNTMYAQGAHMMPALLGVAGKIVDSPNIMLALNPVFGASALLSVYAVARLFIRPRWAFLSVIVMGATLPLLYFSRDTYSEPLAVTMNFGALALLYGAMKSKSLWLWFIAGLTAGGIVLSRVDGYLTLAALAACFAIILAVTKKKERTAKLRQIAVYAIGVSVISLLGYLDITQMSSGYYAGLGNRVQHELYLIAIVVVVGLVAVWLSWKTNILGFIDRLTKKWRYFAVLFVVIAGFIFIASRPLWLEVERTHRIKPSGVVMGLQKAEGKEVNGYRNYTEQSFTWVVWYLGPVMTIMGVGGLALVAAKISKDEKYLILLPLTVVLLGTSLVYFSRPSISSDQIWASRRFLPVIMPGLAIFGAYSFDKLSRQKIAINKLGRSLLYLGVLSTVIAPLFISFPYLRVRTYGNQIDQMNALCQSLPDNPVVIMGGVLRLVGVQSVYTFCDVPTYGFTKEPTIQTIAKLAQIAREKGYTPVIVVDSLETDLVPTSFKNAKAIKTIQFDTLPITLFTPPRGLIGSEKTLLIGEVQNDGSITSPVPAQ